MSDQLKNVIVNTYEQPGERRRAYIICLEMTGGRRLIEIPAGADATEVYLKLEELGEQVVAAVRQRAGIAKPNVANCRPESP